MAPLDPYEAFEDRCRTYAVATFRSNAARVIWYRARRREPWFPADWVVVGDRWAAWTSSGTVARALAKAARGRTVAVEHPVPIAHRASTCDVNAAGCDPAPARPTPMSPTGYVYSYKRSLWSSSLTDTDGGLYVVASTDRETGALTGVIEDSRPGTAGPLAALRITLTSVDERLAPIQLTTVTEAAGTFAFINIPAAADGSCYIVAARAHNLTFIRYATLISRTEYEWTLDLEGRHRFVYSDSARCKT